MTNYVDLSLDFDFFVREDPQWDWGHGEGGSLNDVMRYIIWQHRYVQEQDNFGKPFDIYEATDPHTHADFVPVEVLKELGTRNIDPFHSGFRAGYADSHLAALKFFRKRWATHGAPAMLLQLDAHHDTWPRRRRPDCGNWLRYLMDDFPAVRVVQVYPRWKDPSDDGTPDKRLHVYRNWARYAGETEPHVLRDVFFCRSASWVPPHLDTHFLDALGVLAFKRRLHECEPMIDRTDMVPSDEDVVAMREQYRIQRERIVSDAAEAVELFGDDELEQSTKER